MLKTFECDESAICDPLKWCAYHKQVDRKVLGGFVRTVPPLTDLLKINEIMKRSGKCGKCQKPNRRCKCKFESMKFTGKPVIIGGRLALKEINPLGEPDKKYVYQWNPAACPNPLTDQYKEWGQAESALRTLFVSPKVMLHSIDHIKESDTVTADIDSNNELINLEII